jgi:hypothetical protein
VAFVGKRVAPCFTCLAPSPLQQQRGECRECESDAGARPAAPTPVARRQADVFLSPIGSCTDQNSPPMSTANTTPNRVRYACIVMECIRTHQKRKKFNYLFRLAEDISPDEI